MFNSVFGKKLILSSLLLLGACGGGGGGGTSTSVPTSAPVPPGISSSGTVTGFGSVYVNGVKFNISSTTKISNDDVDDGEVITENDLKVGDVVEVKGTSDDAANANAQSIEMASEVKGPVDNVFNAATKTLVVMGQTVLINNNTAIDNNIGPNGLGDLKVGDLVEVHGFRDATGNIVATRIERQGAVAKFRVRGNISALNSAAKTFKIGNLTVDYSAAQVVPTGTVLADGMRVRVKADSAPVAGKLMATKVKVKKAEATNNSEVEGFITVFTSATNFEVNGQKITTDANTRFEHGSAADLKVGVSVEVEGPQTDTVLTARKIEFKAGGDNNHNNSASTKFAGLVASASLADKTITVLGQKFNVTATTMFEDKVNNTRPFNITNFNSVVKTGAHVQISAFKDGAGLTATRVELNNKAEIFVQGSLAAGATGTKLVISGVEVTIDTGTRFFLDDNRLADFAAFQVKALAGVIVKAKTKAMVLPADTRIDATGTNQGEVEIED